MKQRITQSGFNLMELLVVITIIGILASISLPVYNKHVIKAKIISLLAEVNIYKTELMLCRSSKNSFSGCDIRSTNPKIEITNGNIKVNMGFPCHPEHSEETEIILSPESNGNAYIWTLPQNHECKEFLPEALLSNKTS